jgi:hypothetical protein
VKTLSTEDVLWSLHAKRSIAECVLITHGEGAELLVRQDREVVVRELFADSGVARARGVTLGEQLAAKGWRDARLPFTQTA